jgi:hypothetical protein
MDLTFFFLMLSLLTSWARDAFTGLPGKGTIKH